MIVRWTRWASDQASGSATVVTIAPESRKLAIAASMARSCSVPVPTQGNPGSNASRGGYAFAAASLWMRPGSARHDASNAQSATLRAKTPSVSNVGLNRLTPSKGSVPIVGLKPTTPQYAAGRITDPLVWVPIAAATCPSATAAAEPEDEPPGVCAALQGLRVLPG